MVTIKWVLVSMNLCDYTHVVVQTKDKMPVGGGSVGSVIRRFGDKEIFESYITQDGILKLIVNE